FGLVVSATSILFVISGLNFSRFLRPAIRNAGDLRPTANFILKFAIPAGLWATLRSLWTHSWWLPNLFLLGTFFANPTSPSLTLWYLDVLAANLMVLAGISCLGYYLGARRASATLSADTFRTDLAWVMIGLAMAATQVLGGWWDGQVGQDSVGTIQVVLDAGTGRADHPGEQSSTEMCGNRTSRRAGSRSLQRDPPLDSVAGPPIDGVAKGVC